ncbi:hypothetical protein ACGF7U_31305 [Micromonospora sp. NPDC047670]|uniref:hypothetical protein n=1 Tax=Micromonospora sp. NPDC047670 TaxID=3364252 RepID=UPI003716516B
MTAVASRLWIVAGAVLGRPVPVDGPYPHLCGVTYTETRSRKPYRYQRRDCAACAMSRAGGPG